MNVKKAESVASFERVSNVLGKEQKKHMTAMMAEKPTVQTLPLVIVLRYLAPVITCRPWRCQTNLTWRVQHFYLYHRIVKQKHDRSRIPHPSPIVKEHLTEVAYVPNLRMADTELPEEFSEPVFGIGTKHSPDNQGSVQDGSSDDDGYYDTWNQTEN